MVFTRRTDQRSTSHAAEEMPVASGPGTTALHTAEVTESVIGNDFTIEGQSITIRCKGSLRVNGNIQADLHSTKLTVGKEAIINGGIAADQVDVHGRVMGAIRGANVVLHDTADVEGDILSQYLSIEQGASFDGRSRRVKDPAEIRPQLESTAAMGGGQPGHGAPLHHHTGVQAHPSGQVHAVPLPGAQSKVLHS